MAFGTTRGSGKSLLQVAVLYHELPEFKCLSLEEIYSILLKGFQENENDRENNKDSGMHQED